MPQKKYKVGTNIPSWGEGTAQTITFVVTDDCNLRCKYCYITHKNSAARMSLETAKRFVDFMLEGDFKHSDAVIFEFIGGEPFMEIELIDKVSDYFKLRAFELDHPWYWNYRFNFSTNGINYADTPVQEYIKKNAGKMSCGITIDGTKEKHDMQRIFPDGSGSYDVISKNIDLYISQFNASTKVTFAHDDLPLLKESILSLWDNGITDVAANVVFEDVWNDGDDQIYESQLKSLADHILDNRLYDRYICNFFDDSIGAYYSAELLKNTSCGAGKMMAFGADGSIYPCIRYKGYSLNKKREWVIGNLDEGLDMEKVRPFMTATYQLQSDAECLHCEIATGCNFCQGFNYDEAETPTNFYRAKYICKMHKARVRANDYYFAKLFNRYGIDREASPGERKRLYFLLTDDHVGFCQHANHAEFKSNMSDADIINGLNYAHVNFYNPIFVHSRSQFQLNNLPIFQEHKILHLVPARFHAEAAAWLNHYILVFDDSNTGLPVYNLKNCMLNVRQENVGMLFAYVKTLLGKCDRINVNITGLTKHFDLNTYREQLLLIKDWLVEHYETNNLLKEVSLITDLCFINEHNNCKAGDKAFTLAPDGRLYVCPAFFAENTENSVGDTERGVINLGDARLYKTENNPLCSLCDAYQCLSCVHLNVTTTQEVNVSPSYQCLKSFAEREVARLYQQEIGDAANRHEILEAKYKEPMDIFNAQNGSSVGYYQNICV